ncbi:FAD-dependent oxidoreductase [Alteraurantiacibacter aestuarii]|uniref:FAD-dependent oxidoreductase n=1 Tax=Alteraurantiacibacter aestuarii TaxID=650004 RepID=A0A844ZMB4_9SPHN|nr:FAD-dependent oxidoreductase [Alteraurantiacibacter aestuarii]MXO88908.1 FAD-dependent oxidoreductase [Alteraurantiacibacter aestuarii]
MNEHFDIAVIGAGMAGASLAAELAPHARVLLAEAEEFPGYHATGRSAAFWEECYGGPSIVPLTLASGTWLREGGFLHQRGALYIARDQDEAALQDFASSFAGTGVSIETVRRDEIERQVPGILPGWTQAISEPHCADIDVGALHQHYLGQARSGGVAVRNRHRLVSAQRNGDGWLLQFHGGITVHADILVNAAGAWADPLAQMAGAQALGITPYRRTVAQLRVAPAPAADMPLVLDINGTFYFKPENGRLWLSPHDETPSQPCDAAPEEMDIAVAIDRFEHVVGWKIEALERKWAGLRSFAPDRRPVYGHDPRCDGLFWFAGQGGFGIQTAPAAARLAAQLLLDLPRDDMTKGIQAADYSPARFG